MEISRGKMSRKQICFHKLLIAVLVVLENRQLRSKIVEDWLWEVGYHSSTLADMGGCSYSSYIYCGWSESVKLPTLLGFTRGFVLINYDGN